MILSGREIKRQMQLGRIQIDPFDDKLINPNSINLRLHEELKVYDAGVLDMRKEMKTNTLIIPDKGLVLYPNRLYLGSTLERTHTDYFVPMLEGRSSLGRLGVCVHATAGFGDVGFDGCWTLEISCVQQVRIYPWIEVCQLYYHTIEGNYDLYDGKYQHDCATTASRMHEELIKEGQ